MQPSVETTPTSRKQLWAGRVISALPVLMLLLSGVMKLLKPVPVVEGFAHYGYPESQIVFLGILEIACTLVYVIPQTSYLGAILMTPYLGGATASNVRVGDPSYLAMVILGILGWGGLFFRDARLRALLPFRS